MFLFAGYEVMFSQTGGSSSAIEVTFLYRDQNNYRMDWQGNGIVKNSGKLYFYSTQEDGSKTYVPIKKASSFLAPMIQQEASQLKYYGEGYYKVQFLGKKKKIAGLLSKLYRIKFYNAQGKLTDTQDVWLAKDKNYIDASLKMISAMIEIEKAIYGHSANAAYYKKYREFMNRYGAPTSYSGNTLVKFSVKNVPLSAFKVEKVENPPQVNPYQMQEDVDIDSLPLPEEVKKALKQKLQEQQK